MDGLRGNPISGNLHIDSIDLYWIQCGKNLINLICGMKANGNAKIYNAGLYRELLPDNYLWLIHIYIYIYIYMHAHMHTWGCLTVDAPMGDCMCGLCVLLCMLYILFVNSRTSWSSALDEHASWCGSPFPIFLKQSRKNLVDLVCISNICWSVLHAHDSILYISCQEFFQIFPYFCSSKKPMSTLDDV